MIYRFNLRIKHHAVATPNIGMGPNMKQNSRELTWMFKTFLRILVTFLYSVFVNVFIYKKRLQNGMKMTKNTVSNSNKATTFRQLNRTVPFLAHPVCRHTVWEWFWKKILQSSLAQFEFSCTYLAHGHGIQRSADLTFLFNIYKHFLILPRFFTFFNVFIFVWTFYRPLHLWELRCQLIPQFWIFWCSGLHPQVRILSPPL